MFLENIDITLDGSGSRGGGGVGSVGFGGGCEYALGDCFFFLIAKTKIPMTRARIPTTMGTTIYTIVNMLEDGVVST